MTANEKKDVLEEKMNEPLPRALPGVLLPCRRLVGPPRHRSWVVLSANCSARPNRLLVVGGPSAYVPRG